jgi:hypothetical protein
MMLLRRNPLDGEIIEAVESWMDLLAVGDYGAAFSATKHDAYYGWSADSIRSVIAGYGLAEVEPGEPTFVVTPRESALGGPPRVKVSRDHVPPGALAHVQYDLPLNGEWSDLTATFRVEASEEGCALVLEEIHVF